jgi:hypothetical protein
MSVPTAGWATAPIWISLARVEALGHFGTVEQMHAAMDRLFVLCEPRAAPGGTNA